ncbi:DNA-binding LacI/PurR family transcriptional regulator [Paenibacillus brasilensis]|uniref:DNA-binding LacI/PurR family transcriptional regulator n=1 Tax=Paenibacillus brasilensis TaxID=128574 RepID=A0ABU0L7L7_9BACL|nr:DNA-binding LacI/PurR family transcriptional regulator [Paenibacillus brasilensis]
MDDDAYFGEFLSKHQDVDGIFAITDMLAAKYIERAGRQGIRVPEDAKVIGYDGIQDHPYFHPVLSTIRQPVEEMARMTIRLLYKKIEGKTLDQQVYRLPVIFRQGETT